MTPCFISKAPKIAGILKIIEDHEDVSATVNHLVSQNLGACPKMVRSLFLEMLVFVFDQM